MLGLSIFIVIIAALVFLFRLKRRREVEAFKDANFADFVESDPDKQGSGVSSGEISEIAASVIASSARTIENRKVSEAAASIEAGIVYQKREAVFDDVTRAFLLTLYQVLDNDFQVLVKVPVADLVRGRDANDMSVLPSNDKVDFVICRSADLKVVCGIQLHGGAVDSISAIFSQVEIPFVNLRVGVAYSADELKEKLEGVLPAGQAVQRCDGCNEPMAKKMARGGKHKGNYFWVCAECKVTAPVR